MTSFSLGTGENARRRSELGLLSSGAVVVLVAYLLGSLGVTGSLPEHSLEFLLGMLVVIAIVQIGNRRLVPYADPVIIPIALVLNGIGYVMISRADAFDPREAGYQVVWTGIGLFVYFAILASIRRSRDLERYRYMMLAASFFLLVLPLVPKIGKSPPNTYGAKLWIGLGPLTFQPVEIAKLLLVIFFASYFIEKRELLTIATRRVGNHLFPDLRAFGPILIAGAMALLIILGEHDIGFALLVFVVFLSMFWLTTGRWTYLLVGLFLFGLGTFLASHVLGQVSDRITIWLNPWSDPNNLGYQSIQGELAFGRGGLYGSGLGLGLGAQPNIIPVPTSDMVFAIIGEELGLFGAVAVIVAYVLLIGSGLRTALRARSEFAKLLAAGLTATLGFQTFFIMAGVVRLLPLTGVTLPFVSYGGSSLVANYALLAILMRVSNEGNQPADAGAATPA